MVNPACSIAAAIAAEPHPGASRVTAAHQVVLYSSPGCHLCEEAATLLRDLQRSRDFAFFEVDIHSDPELERLYLIEIPVIELFDERDLFQLSFEHVNYFSHGSLSNLMHRCGFREVEHQVVLAADLAALFERLDDDVRFGARGDDYLAGRVLHDEGRRGGERGAHRRGQPGAGRSGRDRRWGHDFGGILAAACGHDHREQG